MKRIGHYKTVSRSTRWNNDHYNPEDYLKKLQQGRGKETKGEKAKESENKDGPPRHVQKLCPIDSSLTVSTSILSSLWIWSGRLVFNVVAIRASGGMKGGSLGWSVIELIIVILLSLVV